MSYSEQAYSHDMFAADAALDERVSFIRRTYSTVFGAIMVFMGLEFIILSTPTLRDPILSVVGNNWWMALIAFMVVSWLAGHWAHSDTSQGMQYFGLGVYVLAEAIIFVPLLVIASLAGENVIPTAAFLTLLIFGGLTAVVFFTRQDFSFLKNILWVGSFAALGVIIASAFIGFQLGFVFAAAMVALMSGFILYDTSNILHHYRTDQHVGAALALFASIATLFWYVIQLVMLSDD